MCTRGTLSAWRRPSLLPLFQVIAASLTGNGQSVCRPTAPPLQLFKMNTASSRMSYSTVQDRSPAHPVRPANGRRRSRSDCACTAWSKRSGATSHSPGSGSGTETNRTGSRQPKRIVPSQSERAWDYKSLKSQHSRTSEDWRVKAPES